MIGFTTNTETPTMLNRAEVLSIATSCLLGLAMTLVALALCLAPIALGLIGKTH